MGRQMRVVISSMVDFPHQRQTGHGKEATQWWKPGWKIETRSSESGVEESGRWMLNDSR
jgi:hypothetical protein